MSATAFYEVPIDEWAAYLQLAAERLHVKFVGLTHELLLQVAGAVRASLELAENHDEDGKLTIQGTLRVQEAAGKAWRAAMSQWRASFEAARWEGAYLALATVARMHYHYFAEEAESESGQGSGSAATAATEARRDRRRGLDEQGSPWWGAMRRGWPMGRPIPWVGDIDRVLKALEQRVYSDGFTLSQRIWRLDQVSLQGIRDALYKGYLEGKTIWDVAADLEQFLGAGKDCPRWTKERLTLTPEEIAGGDETGLIRGDACAGQGVAYNALRLAVNEIQTAVQAMLREIHAQQPWAKGERLYLNDLHTVVYNCECERIAGYPPNMVSEVLPVGTVELPLHPWCSPAGQMVQTPDGCVPIEGVQPGDMVLTHSGQFQTVQKVMAREYQGDLIEIETENGKRVQVTPDHPVLSGGNWIPAGELVTGAQIEVSGDGG